MESNTTTKTIEN